MIRRGTWISLGLFVVVLAFALWWTRGRPGSSGPPETTPTIEPIWELDSTQVVGLRIDDLAGSRVVELRRKDADGWELVQPISGTIDDAQVETALSWLASPRPRGVLAEPDDLEPYGLSEPVVRVTVTLGDGSTRVLEVGAETPGGTTTYARLPGEQGVLVVSKYGLGQVLGLVDDAFAPTATPTAAETATSTAEPTVAGPLAPSSTWTPAPQ